MFNITVKVIGLLLSDNNLYLLLRLLAMLSSFLFNYSMKLIRWGHVIDLDYFMKLLRWGHVIEKDLLTLTSLVQFFFYPFVIYVKVEVTLFYSVR